MSVDALVDGAATGVLPPGDRGLCYGDGLFETIRIAAGLPVWWEAHLRRLARGCEALGLAMPADAVLREDLDTLRGGRAEGVVRLLLTRGDGERGYLPRAGNLRRLLTWHPPPPAPGPALRVGWAGLRLAVQPRLAGHKHLNRLEQVLAARDCAAQGWDEALLCDSEGAVTCGIAGNLFLVRGGRLETPLLDRCGVAGTCRAWILATHPACRVLRLQPAAVEQADELFLCNSVRGILPVQRLASRELPPGPVTRALMRRLAREVPAFGPERD